MHDPKVVAFEIRRPWPQRDRSHDAKPGRQRWSARYSWATWRKPWSGWMAFWVVAGRGFYWPSMITIWHVEPNGRDALTVCRDRVQRPDGSWKYVGRWKLHVHHWKIQVSPLQNLRRRLLTRCEECGRKGSPDTSHQWDGERGPWWKGERGLFHSQCSSLVSLIAQKARDEAIIIALAAEIRVRSDESHEELLERLTGPRNAAMEFHSRYRLQKILASVNPEVETK